ncbi:MAG: hypothetical protein AB1758_08190, partial [Candidatus Eremiobacterota bacterium]
MTPVSPLKQTSGPPSRRAAGQAGPIPEEPTEVYTPGEPQPAAEGPRLTPGRVAAVAAAMLVTGLGIAGSLIPWPAQPPPQAVVQPAPQTVAALEVPVPEAVAGAIVHSRSGQLLSSGRILKVDQYPGVQHPDIPVSIPGAPNYRQVQGTDIHGVAQPTVEGLRAVLREVGADQRPIVWTTMREEPAIYLNGRSLTLRDLATPIANLEQP